MRIGLFGGTFNPVHYGHLRAATEVYEGLDLDNIYFIPSALPPHKDISKMVSAVDRIEMTRMAISENPEFILSDVELKRSGLSFTIDTIKHFKKSLDTNAELFLIMGVDAFLEIDTWKSFELLFKMLPMIIMTRPRPDGRPHSLEWNNMTEFIQKKISSAYHFFEEDSCYRHEQHYPVYRFNINLLDISGTNIRNRIQQGKSIRFLTPESVENYIYERGIYA